VYGHIELAYVGVQVPDPTALSSFFDEVVGLVPITFAVGPCSAQTSTSKVSRSTPTEPPP
jgi:hypothetical protein